MGVTFFNPLLSLLSISVLPIANVISFSETVLAQVALVIGEWLEVSLGIEGLDVGRYFHAWVSIDAFVVLSGAVLTAYVGIDGLLYQMALDGCLPEFFLVKNTWRNTNHYIIITYFLLATSQILLMEGDVDALAGVYSFAFLGVMLIFCIGTMMLKFKRSTLPREVVSPWWHVIVGALVIVVAIIANLKSKPQYLQYFLFYFTAVGLITFLMFQRVRLIKLLLYFGPLSIIRPLRQHLRAVRCDEVVFFCKNADLYVMNKALLYVRSNESTAHALLVVHLYENEHDIPPKFKEYVEMMDRMYVGIKVSLLKVRAPFCPAVVEILSKQLGIPKNEVSHTTE